MFNSTILEQFFPVFNDKNKILIRNVMKELNGTQAFDLWGYIAPFSLDTICRKYIINVDDDLENDLGIIGILFLETTMGYNLDTLSNPKESEFAEAFIK